MNIILNGASGSGKGSMAGFLVRDFGLVHISTGYSQYIPKFRHSPVGYGSHGRNRIVEKFSLPVY